MSTAAGCRRAVKSAAEIYDEAVRRARADHKQMMRKFMRGEIDVASPSGLDRERQYIIDAFAKAIGEKE